MAEERRKTRKQRKKRFDEVEEKQELNKISDGGRTWPTFDVWRPNGNFKKSHLGEPRLSNRGVSRATTAREGSGVVVKHSKNVKLKIANVESGAIMLFDLEAGLAR